MVFESQEPKESFNMAVATLMRLDGILKRMQLISETTSGIVKQKLMIEELRHFFLNATPLVGNIIDSETKEERAKSFEEYKARVFKIRVPTRLMKGKRIEYYSRELENEIISILIDLQIKIKGYFMPPARERRMF